MQYRMNNSAYWIVVLMSFIYKAEYRIVKEYHNQPVETGKIQNGLILSP